MTIRVFVVDDHVMIRTGMCMILAAQPELEVVGQAESGEDALPALRRLRPDVLVCDVHLPGVSGLEVTERVVRGGYGTRVIVVSALQEGPLPRRAIERARRRMSARATMRRNCCERCATWRAANAISPRASRSRSRWPASTVAKARRSIRCRRANWLLTQGLRQEDIARRLSLSAKTINTHKARLFDKLGIRDPIALARMASRYGMADPARAW